MYTLYIILTFLYNSYLYETIAQQVFTTYRMLTNVSQCINIPLLHCTYLGYNLIFIIYTYLYYYAILFFVALYLQANYV